jgi:hypothetical protein
VALGSATAALEEDASIGSKPLDESLEQFHVKTAALTSRAAFVKGNFIGTSSRRTVSNLTGLK